MSREGRTNQKVPHTAEAETASAPVANSKPTRKFKKRLKQHPVDVSGNVDTPARMESSSSNNPVRSDSAAELEVSPRGWGKARPVQGGKSSLSPSAALYAQKNNRMSTSIEGFSVEASSGSTNRLGPRARSFEGAPLLVDPVVRLPPSVKPRGAAGEKHADFPDEVIQADENSSHTRLMPAKRDSVKLWSLARADYVHEVLEPKQKTQHNPAAMGFHFLEEVQDSIHDHNKMWHKGNALFPGHIEGCTGVPPIATVSPATASVGISSHRRGSAASGPHTQPQRKAGGCPACCLMRQSSVAELNLWLAAREGRHSDATVSLMAGARVDWTLPADVAFRLEYKNRNLSCQAIHAAAAFQFFDDDGIEGDSHESMFIVQTLLKFRADVAAQASVMRDVHQRMLQSIHIAAGTGNASTVKLLVDRNADPDAAASSDHKVHYLPIHDAVWFNRVNCMRCLLESSAKVQGRNIEGATALHIATLLGHVHIVEILLDQEAAGENTMRHSVLQGVMSESKKLVGIRDARGKTCFDIAMENGQFPPRDLHLLTDHLQDLDKAEAFLKVAHSCPAAASALLRGGDGGGEDSVMDEGWRQSLQLGAQTDRITAEVFGSLIEKAPQAAMDLIDALTDEPSVQDKQHHPLPVRAKIPKCFGEPCSISCIYAEDDDWQWSPLEQKYHGGKPWHDELAPLDPRTGQEVKIRVMKLRGVVDVRVLTGLAQTPDLQIFTKILTQALLKYTWSRFIWLFQIDLAYKSVAMAVISLWVWYADPPSDLARRLLWCVVASQATVQCVMFLFSAVNCWMTLSWDHVSDLIYRTWYRLVIGVLTICLAQTSHVDHWPDTSRNSNELLALTAWLHGVLLLFELRGFRWTGQRLLPIMKSMQPIGGMVVIIGFLLFSFVHAFWAMDRARADGVRFFQVVIFLLAGENFIENEDLEGADIFPRAAMIFLGLFAMFIFLACALNVFIAVLGDCYDQEQDRVLCTFLKERAKICSSLFLRPGLKRPECVSNICLPIVFVVAPLTAAFIFVFLLHISMEAKMVSWLPALFLAGVMLTAQAFLKGELTDEWDERYIWLCYDTHIKEEFFLTSAVSPVESHGRINKVKNFVMEQSKATSAECKSEINSVRQDMRECRNEVSEIKRSVREVHEQLALQQQTLDYIAKQFTLQKHPTAKEGSSHNHSHGQSHHTS